MSLRALALAASSVVLLASCSSLRQAPPRIESSFAGIPLNGGRVAAISVDPANANRVVLAMQFGGLWETGNGGANWRRVFGLPGVFVRDVVIGDGGTIIATLQDDNGVVNGGGIHVSRDGGGSWVRPPTGVVPQINGSRARSGGWDISRAPDEPRTWYVGTDAGIARSDDDGMTWNHFAVRPAIAPIGFASLGPARSVLAFGGGTVLARMDSGIWRSDDRGATWREVRRDDFSFGAWTGQNMMSRSTFWPYAFIMKDYSTLLLYELATERWTVLPLPAGGQSRGPFVKVGRGAISGTTTIWVGQGTQAAHVTRRRIGSLRALTAADWTVFGRGQGVHDDMGDMGLDAAGRPVMIGSDGGAFRRDPEDGTRWISAAPFGSGMNSLQITDLAGTNVHAAAGVRTNLYFSTQDNALWASEDGGASFPRSDCAEGFHMEVQPIAVERQTPRLGYGKVGCSPNSNFSKPHFVDAAAVPDVDSGGASLANMSQAFYLGRNSSIADQIYWLRYQGMPGQKPAVWFSINNGDVWRKRFEFDLAPLGVFGRAYSTSPLRALRPWTPVNLNEPISDNTASRVGLVRLSSLQLSTVRTIGAADVIRLPANGSPGLRATEFDWQVVYGVTPAGLIVPDIVNNDVKISRDGGTSFTTDAALTNLVTDGGRLLMWAGGAYNMQVTHISYDPYRPQRLLVGTRDAGVICSPDGGASWRRIKNSKRINYVTGFFTLPGGGLWISSYGHGLWRASGRESCGQAPVDATAVRAAGGLNHEDAALVMGQTAVVPPPEPDPPEEATEPPPFRPAGARLFVEGGRDVAGVPIIDSEDRIALAGRGFAPGAAIEVSLDGVKLMDTRADGGGDFRITIPTRGLVAGEHRLLVRAGDTQRLAMFVRGAADEALGKPPLQPPPARPGPVDEGPPDVQEQGKPTLDPRAVAPGRQLPAEPPPRRSVG